jgi:hypothetical protein
LRALPIFLAKRCRLVDSAALRQQLTSLERRVSGVRETVSHPAVASAHDDLATAVCGALVVAGNRLAFDGSFVWVTGEQPAANEIDQQRAREAEANAEWRRSRYAAYLLSGGGNAGGFPFNGDGTICWDRLPRGPRW